MESSPDDPYEMIKNLLTTASDDPDEPLTFRDIVENLMQEHDSLIANTHIFVKVSFGFSTKHDICLLSVISTLTLLSF